MPACSQAGALQNTGAPDFTNGHSKGAGNSCTHLQARRFDVAQEYLRLASRAGQRFG
jgi:hypothetical protein